MLTNNILLQGLGRSVFTIEFSQNALQEVFFKLKAEFDEKQIQYSYFNAIP